ncbi:MAG: phosphate signaling complex protein PhoU [Armatimonadota bacterium]
MPSGDTRKAFNEELDSLQSDLQEMGKTVDEMLALTICALIDGNVSSINEIEEMDDIVDRYNIEIETKALRLLALQQPMARDLRTIAAAMKIITDIERAGDYAVDISKIVEKLSAKPLFKPLVDIPRMANLVQQMLKETLTAFVSRDLNLVQDMISHDEEVDALYESLYHELSEYIIHNPELTEQALGLILIARYLERMADHITNIGERIYYMQTGALKELHK